MKNSIIIELVQNAAILLAFAMLYENFWIKNENSKSIGAKILMGFILSGICVVLMFTPWTWVPGMIFDTRSVMISIAGLFFGPIPTIITMTTTGIIRLLIGGDGKWMGIAVIISSGTIGLLWRNLRPNWKINKYYFELLAMGILVHFTMALCTLLLPYDKILLTLKTIALPLIFIYVPSTMLLGIIMLKQYKNSQNRLAQIKLVESERRLTQVLESGNIISLLLNIDGSIKYCNNYLLQITGYSQNEVLGKSWFSIFIPKDIKDDIYQIFSDSISAKNIVIDFENAILSKSGEYIYISWYTTVFHSDSNEVIGVANVGVNITDSKIYERKLEEKNNEYKQVNRKLTEAKEKAEESDRLKSAFLANMSHEIRTPMNGILGFAELLKEPDLSGEQQQKYIQVIEKSGARMLNIINDIVSISKIESGVLDVNLSETNINNQFQFVYDSLIIDANNKNLSLSFHCALPEQEAIIKTDSEKFYRILSNLVKNALKYTDKGTIEFGYSNKGEEFEFYINDTGIGIPKDKQETIFKRFIQADIEDKMARQGAGLGLAIARAYVKILGGSIWLESEVGIGSTFFFTLPGNKDVERKTFSTILSDKEEKQIIPKNSGLKVLIAEDDETSEMLISIELKKFSREILKVTTGKDAIEICRQHPDIDLVLMDIQMPGMNGYEATRKIREFNKDLVIIAQTAFAMTGDREKAIEAGCNDYISKPIRKNELLSLIQTYFKK